jgi:CheY-like chemotaxis protein
MKEVEILLIEDNEGDIFLTKEAFEESKVACKIIVCKNGKDALDYLFKRGIYGNAQKPDLILLDINIPIINGLEVLKKIKLDEELRKIPIIMLTTSANKSDIDAAYLNYANSYIIKPIEMQDFLDAVLKIEDFWLKLTVLAK